MLSFAPTLRVGRVHISFDPYTSVPVAVLGSGSGARVHVELADDAQNVVAVTDVLIRIERVLAALDPDRRELVRVARISMQSPLELILWGGPAVALFGGLVARVVATRKTWYEGTKAKYEAEGARIDNVQKRRAIQLEADRELRKAIRAEVGDGDPEVLPELAQPGLPMGGTGSPERERLASAAEETLSLPLETSVDELPSEDVGPSS